MIKLCVFVTHVDVCLVFSTCWLTVRNGPGFKEEKKQIKCMCGNISMDDGLRKVLFFIFRLLN